MFRTRSLSLMYCVNLAETSHTLLQSTDFTSVYLSVKNWQLQVSNICHIINMFRTRSLSLMYCVNLAETLHTLLQSTVNTCLNNLII